MINQNKKENNKQRQRSTSKGRPETSYGKYSKTANTNFRLPSNKPLKNQETLTEESRRKSYTFKK